MTIDEPSPILNTLISSRKRFDTVEKAESLVNYLISTNKFKPTHFGQYEPFHSFNENKILNAVDMIVEKEEQSNKVKGIYSMTFFSRRINPTNSIRIEWSNLPHIVFSNSWFSIEDDFIRNFDNLDEWINHLFGFIDLFDAWYAFFALGEEQRQKNYILWKTKYPKAIAVGQSGIGFKLEKGIPGVYWGNYFGPFLVDWFGYKKIEKMPSIKKIWLKNGGLFFITALSPFDWNTPESTELQNEIK
ncbi:MAG: hypothetical protein JXA42_14595, partial [Anaerolineales bacterium]|nr:hypothetical protein [Anaerolineales bacterium]